MTNPTWRDDGDRGWSPTPPPPRKLHTTRAQRRLWRYINRITADLAYEDQAIRVAHGEGGHARTSETPARWTTWPATVPASFDGGVS